MSKVDFQAAAQKAADIAAVHADDVDTKGRFPSEAMAAIKQNRLLSMMISPDSGGYGADLAQVAQVCATLSKACASTGMIFAMHQIKLSSMISHGDNDWHRAFLKRISAEQLLLASATTETGIGGDLRNSICAVETTGDGARLTKDATVISYAEDADAILLTARKNADAQSSDQVMVVALKDQYTLKKTTEWNTLGMRGTRSEGFIFNAEFPVAQVLPKPFAEIAAQSMLANCHILWSAIWLGIANAAMAKAQAFVKGEVKRAPAGTQPRVVQSLAEADIELHLMRANIVDAIKRFKHALKNQDELNSVSFGVAMLNLKIASSQFVVDIVTRVMLICGIAGYRNDTPFSMGRLLRDAHSAPLMISNNRIYPNLGNALLVAKIDAPLDV